jgi:hypothetical protein
MNNMGELERLIKGEEPKPESTIPKSKSRPQSLVMKKLENKFPDGSLSARLK